jgi:hypothetical protein
MTTTGARLLDAMPPVMGVLVLSGRDAQRVSDVAPGAPVTSDSVERDLRASL